MQIPWHSEWLKLAEEIERANIAAESHASVHSKVSRELAKPCFTFKAEEGRSNQRLYTSY